MAVTGPSANTRQVGGSHYVATYQHWDLVADGQLGYFEGQITKYVGRSRRKNGLQDLDKAGHFVDKTIELTTSEPKRYFPRNLMATPAMVARYCVANNLSHAERRVTEMVCFWRDVDQLREARSAINEMMSPAFNTDGGVA